MSLKEELQDNVKKILTDDRWTVRNGQVVPEPEDLQLRNDAVKLNATVLYADMSGSTTLVDNYEAHVAAEIYKSYMVCTARIIKEMGGTITAYDGDRIMGTFIGDLKDTNAARAALHINWAVRHIINPAIKREYGANAYQLSHVIGIDSSPLFACRIGVRKDNDIVWVGRAANYAAKLTTLSSGYSVFITGRVFNQLEDTSKYGGNPKRLMWEERVWSKQDNMTIYRSNWIWDL